MYIGLAVSLSIAFFVGVGIPILLYQPGKTGLIMLGTGILLTSAFVAVAMLAAVRTRDKAKGIGVAILLWLYFSILFDGLVLFVLFQFADYPLEKAMIVVTAFNPIDLSRILILLQLDVSAMMGYTGAIFKDFFGTALGATISVCVLVLWSVLPVWLATRRFIKKDL